MCTRYLSQLPAGEMSRLFGDRYVPPTPAERAALDALPAERFPKRPAEIIRRSGADQVRSMICQWGLPTPEAHLRNAATGRLKVDPGVANVRRTNSGHWRRWLGPANRCLVPVSRFAENRRRADGSYEPVWFELTDAGPGFFAGIFVEAWTSVRSRGGPTTDDLFGFLTTDANAEVKAIHPKAMPVLLTRPEEWDAWLDAPWPIAQQLQRPLPDGALSVVTG